MKLKSLLMAGAVATVLGSVPAVAAYLPTGPQTNVAVSTVTGGGWSLCYSGTMAVPFGTNAATTLANCGGNRLMMAGRETGSSTLLVLAQALKTDALFNTGAANNGVFHNANGSDWFYADNYSWGFKTPGDAFTKNQCSFNVGPGPSMCIHTLSFTGGFSINQITGLNGSTAYEKLVFQYNGNGAVPEPATWALMIGGFGAIGGTMRYRRRRTSVSFA
jgi:PEP-CTERM motif